jgi:hypothetical protein
MFKKQSTTFLYRATASRDKKPRAVKRTGALRSASRAPKGQRSRRIGIWDVDVNAGFLYRVLDVLNHRQKLFKFQRIEATVPMGLTAAGTRTREIVEQYGGDPDSPDIAENTFAGDILKVARPMARSLEVDLLVCVVAPMIMDRLSEAEDGKDGIGWNFFSTSYADVAIVSAFALRDYAAKANRPFEAALAAVLLGSVLTAVFNKLKFHDETRGCILDYCENRADIVEMLRGLNICEESLAQIPKDAWEPVRKMLNTIKEYQR